MASVEDVYGSPYLKAAEVPEGGCEGLIVEIGPEKFQKRGEREKHKLVMRLSCFKKTLALNTTNARRLAKAFGDDWEQWPGRKVTVTIQEVTFEGEVVDGIVLVPVPLQQATPS